MKSIIFLLLFISSYGFSQTLSLLSEKVCHIYENKNDVNCKKENEETKIVHKNNEWLLIYGAEEDKSITLYIVFEDKNLIILNQHVFFSGTRMFYLNKKDNGFIISEISYSEMQKSNISSSTTGKYSISL